MRGSRSAATVICRSTAHMRGGGSESVCDPPSLRSFKLHQFCIRILIREHAGEKLVTARPYQRRCCRAGIMRFKTTRAGILCGPFPSKWTERAGGKLNVLRVALRTLSVGVGLKQFPIYVSTQRAQNWLAVRRWWSVCHARFG